MYDYLLFDLDGTLTDSGPGIVNAVKYALAQQRLRIPDERVLNNFIGPPLTASFNRHCGLEDAALEKAVADFRVYYREKGMFENRPYEGVETMLQTARNAGKFPVLCTSKLERTAVEIVRHFGLAEYFELMVGGVDGERSEKSEVISYALDRLRIRCGTGFAKKCAVMIGDRENDIRGASENGIDSIGVLYGYGSERELKNAGAGRLATRPEEILQLI